MGKDVVIWILYDENKKILFQLRTKDAPKYPGYWSLFGGHIEDYDASPEVTVKREMLEELNYPLEDAVLFKEPQVIDGSKKYFYVEKCKDKECLVLNEGADMKWFTTEEAKTLHLVPYQKEKLDEIQAFLDANL